MKIKRLIMCALLGLSLTGVAHAQNKSLAVPMYYQQYDRWCWDATSQMMMQFLGKSVAQCTIANWALGVTNACYGPSNGPRAAWNNAANGSPGWAWEGKVMQAWGLPGGYVYNRALSQSEIVSAINANKPIALEWAWYAGSGHAVVLTGYKNNGATVLINDPWDGPVVYSYASAKQSNIGYWAYSVVAK